MASWETFVAIDIGSSKIKAVIGEWNEEKKLRVLGVWVSESHGIRKWNILDMEEFKNNLDVALADAEKMTGDQVSHVFVGVSWVHIDIAKNTGIVAVHGTEVTDEDVNRALDMSQNGIDLMNRNVLKVIPESFSLDLESGIKNPVGMSGKKLEIRSHILSIGSNILNNLRKGINDIGVEIIDIYPNVLAAGEAALTRRQKELGVVCLDMGSSVTNVAVYEEWSLIFAGVVPIGWEHVTSDLALWLRISIDTAEKLKLEYGDLNYGTWLEKDVDQEIDLSKFSNIDTISISRKFMTEIMKARYQEIFHYVNMQLKNVGRDGMLPEWAVLTGWSAKMRGLLDLARESLRLPASIGIAEDLDGASGTSIGDPIYTSVIWVLLVAQKYGNLKKPFKLNLSLSHIIASIKNFFKRFMP